MKTIAINFKRVGKYFMMSMECLSGAIGMSLVRGASAVYNGMNGRFGRRRLKEPYIYIWRIIAWGLLIWAVFMWVCVPFFRWWDKVVAWMNWVIWG